jgi:hypothetical protein
LNPLGKPSLGSLLQEFWSAVQAGANKLVLLQDFAARQPVLKSTRSFHAVRREHNAERIKARWHSKPCFVCVEHATQEHHIIQIQYGGTNRRENKVWVCTPCHRRIHPHMAEAPKNAPTGVVPYVADTERQTKCPACGCAVITVAPRLRTRRRVAQSLRPILMQPTAIPPYRTTDLHHDYCLNKSGLHRMIAADLRQLAKRDVRMAEAGPHG